MALIATYSGAGLTAMPYVFYHMGIYYATLALLTVTIFDALSFMMLLKAKDLTPGRYESFFEISYIIFGRRSIFIYYGNLFICNFGVIIVFYTIFGDILSNLATLVLVGHKDVGKDD